MPGETVRRLVEGQDSQRGFVSHMRCCCHLQILGKNFIICNIPTSDLRPLAVSNMFMFMYVVISYICNYLHACKCSYS